MISGITGLETKKHVPDNVMEEHYSDEDEEDEEETGTGSQTEEDSESEYDSDGLRAYTVANNNDFVAVEVKSKVKTKGGKYPEQVQEQAVEVEEGTAASEDALPQPPKEVIPEDPWSQAQQKAFETAIKQFPKGATERWERIANKVPGKTKEQCIQRFKILAEMVKKKKAEAI